jgi:hypothetical protein
VCRDHRALALLAQDAAYLFDRDDGSGFHGRFRALGRFIVEGSKPGAAAAAAYVTHKVLPLDTQHFGRISAATIRAAEHFRARARLFADALAGTAHVLVPFEPDTNLVCLAVNPVGNRSAGRMNAFVRGLVENLRVDAAKPVQVKQFFGSSTTLRPESLGHEETARILAALDLDPGTVRAAPASPDEADSLLILRHTLMNPFLQDETNGIDYVDLYFEYLEGLVRAATSASARP